MHISPYFRNLRSAYFAELDDMKFDSEGKHVLNRRLAQRRREIDFLASMLEASPEMVAVVLHQGFRFKSPAVMDHLLSLESDKLPAWDSLAQAIELEPWAHELAVLLRKQPKGDWFLVVASALEYMCIRHERPQAAAGAAGEEEEEKDTDDGVEDRDHETGEPEDEELREERERDEAGAEWLVEQGFDRKDNS